MLAQTYLKNINPPKIPHRKISRRKYFGGHFDEGKCGQMSHSNKDGDFVAGGGIHDWFYKKWDKSVAKTRSTFKLEIGCCLTDK